MSKQRRVLKRSLTGILERYRKLTAKRLIKINSTFFDIGVFTMGQYQCELCGCVFLVALKRRDQPVK